VRDALFDPVAGTREALLPSAWDGSVAAPPLAGAATGASAGNGSPTASAPAAGLTGGSGSGAALPLPDDPSLN
jgi:hypothetical protein